MKYVKNKFETLYIHEHGTQHEDENFRYILYGFGFGYGSFPENGFWDHNWVHIIQTLDYEL